VLIGCDDILLTKELPVPHRITLWDTATGAVAHQLEVPAGMPRHIDVSPNGRYLIASVEGPDGGMKLCGWRLDGVVPARGPEPGPASPARPR
jgi:hypothetical protein